jgi:hypothetical protein
MAKLNPKSSVNTTKTQTTSHSHDPKFDQKTVTTNTVVTKEFAETSLPPVNTPSTVSTSNTDMVSKTKVNSYDTAVVVDNDENSVLRIIGLGVIIIGVLALLILGIIAIVTRISPRVDKTMEKPVIVTMSEFTNKDSVLVEGTVKGTSEVILYVDGKVDSVLSVKNDRFSKDFKFKDEKKYTFESASVKGIIFRSRSEKSEPVSTIYDKTSPVAKIELIDLPKEIGTPSFNLHGKAEPNSIIAISKDGKEYIGKTDSEGKFDITSIALNPGLNTFNIEIRDLAGNVTKVKETFSITYNTRTSINGAGVSTNTNQTANTLPNSAGIVDDAMLAIAQNKVIFGFGLFALILFIANSSVVAVKLYRNK